MIASLQLEKSEINQINFFEIQSVKFPMVSHFTFLINRLIGLWSVNWILLADCGTASWDGCAGKI
jgi:hypothetical protein